MKNNYVIVMAGGVGSRFWPMSKTSFPKQFHDVLGIGKTLIQLTIERFEKICPKENIYIVTNESYKTIVKKQLPFLHNSQILSEPFIKNTAPCIAYASFKIITKNPNAKLIVAPSDHLIINQQEFEKTINTAIQQVNSGDHLITIGIKPDRPDTGYGYIQYKEGFSGVSDQVKKVKTFTEKPPIETAKRFVNSGDYYWNSGMFVWSAKSIISALKKHLPDTYELFSEISEKLNSNKEKELISKVYSKCNNISIDNGVMEKANNVLVILADLGWSDLGTWSSLYEKLNKNNDNNAIIGEKILTPDSYNNIIVMPNDKLALIQGLSDYIIVENDNMLLICKKENEQHIKSYVNEIAIRYGNKYI